MAKIVVEVTHPPFGHEQAFAGLYVALASLSKAVDAVVVLSGDGVFCALKGQDKPLERLQLPPTEEEIRDILDMGGRVVVQTESLTERAIAPEDLIDGVETLARTEVFALISGHGEMVISF